MISDDQKTINLCILIAKQLVKKFSINEKLSDLRLKGFVNRLNSQNPSISEPAISIGLTELNTALNVPHRIQEIVYMAGIDTPTTPTGLRGTCIRWSGYGNPPCRDPVAWLLGFSGNSPIYKYLIRKKDNHNILDGYTVPMSICTECKNDPNSFDCEDQVWSDTCSVISNLVSSSKTK
jgi:hypothetical protein